MAGKLTDSEIVKALECAIRNDCDCNCVFLLPNKVKDVLDLINRQDEKIQSLQAENERLFSDNQKYLSVMLWGNKKQAKNLVNNIKAEAYKEFAERLKEKGKSEFACCNGWVDFEDIDNLLKELVGD